MILTSHISLSKQENEISVIVPPEFESKRLDQFISDLNDVSQLTRSRIQALIKTGNIFVNNSPSKAGYRVKTSDCIRIVLPPPEPSVLIPEKIDFLPLHEDNDLIVLSKPPGLVVHPAHGHSEGTLVHGLLHHCQDLSGIGGELRPGIVHRLDKDTSGIMIVAKNDKAHNSLIGQFKGRKVEKRYLAILAGVPLQIDGQVDLPIGRHPVHRKKMSVLPDAGRESLTYWHVIEKFKQFSFVGLKLATGRTHQIRVHMASLGCPVAGDELYGWKKAFKDYIIPRQCLHSYFLSFFHPVTGEKMTFTAPLWPDIENFLFWLRNNMQV